VFGSRRRFETFKAQCKPVAIRVIDQISAAEANAILSGRHYLGPVN